MNECGPLWSNNHYGLTTMANYDQLWPTMEELDLSRSSTLGVETGRCVHTTLSCVDTIFRIRPAAGCRVDGLRSERRLAKRAASSSFVAVVG